ncbi:hypothetical protein [Nocardioides jejuensis]|uniref:Uncharacterized protein n=1 Tax=Nocardioides jejuensis TaxID=2502782 RepID=A0A4R1BZA8_9ACTN|nr:hypothetical protein [Nocardioides jejuensis]TCJ23047.1 hypothetical protein EPD65_11840 [Nocardioides jejuensis]
MKATPSTVARLGAFLQAIAVAPTPGEPTGLAAVVRAANGDLYVRAKATTVTRHWTNAYGMNDHTRYRWDQLPGPLEVVFAGVEVEP